MDKHLIRRIVNTLSCFMGILGKTRAPEIRRKCRDSDLRKANLFQKISFVGRKTAWGSVIIYRLRGGRGFLAKDSNI